MMVETRNVVRLAPPTTLAGEATHAASAHEVVTAVSKPQRLEFFFFVMSQWVTEEEWWSFSWRGEKKTDVFTDVICRLTSFSVSCFQCGLTAAPAVGSWMQRLLDSFKGGLFILLPTQTEGLGLRFGCSGVRGPILVGRPTECTQGCAGKQHQCCVHCCRPKPTLIVVGLAFESLCSL